MTLHAQWFGLTAPWVVERVELKLTEGEDHLFVALPAKKLWVCPECLERAPIHDHRERVWRHLDAFQYRTLLHARVPRLKYPNHGIRQIRVQWAEDRSRLTVLFETLAIDWMKQALISAIAKQLHLSWDEAEGIHGRAVRRGLARRKAEPVRYLGIDETSFRRRHRYVTVVTDLERPRVHYVAGDCKLLSLGELWAAVNPEQLGAVEAVAMDMWEPYIGAVTESIPRGADRFVFDKCHIVKHRNDAVDTVFRRENRAFRAWALKEELTRFWDYRHPGAANLYFRSWHRWPTRSRMKRVMRVPRMIVPHYDNIATYFQHRIMNAPAERPNAAIQRVEGMARGCRNPERIRMSVYFHCGNLVLCQGTAILSQ